MLHRQPAKLESPICTVLIPARGGSKGIPRKNLQRVAGVSLLERAIKTCQRAKLVNGGVYVSTEDPEIASVASNCEASVINRWEGLATDETSSLDVILRALPLVQPIPDVLVWVQCTAPLLSAADINGTIRTLCDRHADTAVAIAPFHGFVVGEDLDGDLHGIGWDMHAPLKRRQDLPPRYVLAGSVWCLNVRSFLRRRTVYGAITVGYHVQDWIDIDTPDDLHLADLILRDREETTRNAVPQIYYPL